MKRLLTLLAAAWLFAGCGLLTAINWDGERIASATGKAVTAMAISDEQIVELCRQSVAQLDQQNTIDNGAYITRLRRLMSKVGQINGMTLNYKVYRTSEVNAFASGDGSVRVYSGLMDLMTDDELVAVIGHEIGHVVHQDSKNALKKAYMASAASDLVGAAGSVGAVTQAVAGNIGQALVNAQFSQKQEYKADEYGFEFAVAQGYDPYGMYNSLMKLTQLAESSQASSVAQMFSSHPDNLKRAEKMKVKADNYTKKK
ncbi:MAG: M48 family metalloprotease [Bacteroidales bacterium]|jgi:putative metalloprotease|nr:M48 family metalloprotease [Bacteroidales bacterium]